MRNLTGIATVLIGAFGLNAIQEPDQTQPPSEVHYFVSEPVDDNPFSRPEVVPTPVPDPVPNAAQTDEQPGKAQPAGAMVNDIVEAGKLDQILSGVNELLSRKLPTSAAGGLDEASLRKVINDEVTLAILSKPRLAGSGSTGGSSSFGSPSPPFVQQSQGSCGSSGGATSTISGYSQPSDQLEVVVHTFADGTPCVRCDEVLTLDAPTLMASGVSVVSVADVRTGGAPVIELRRNGRRIRQYVGRQPVRNILAAFGR